MSDDWGTKWEWLPPGATGDDVIAKFLKVPGGWIVATIGAVTGVFVPSPPVRIYEFKSPVTGEDVRRIHEEHERQQYIVAPDVHDAAKLERMAVVAWLKRQMATERQILATISEDRVEFSWRTEGRIESLEEAIDAIEDEEHLR